MKIEARKLLQFPRQHLWENLWGHFDLEFEDGIILPTRRREVLISSYFWDLHRVYSHTPILSTHCIANGTGRKFDNEVLRRLLTTIYRDLCQAYRIKEWQDRDRVHELIYKIVNWLYNELTTRCEEYVSTVDPLDFLEIHDHPDVQRLLKSVEPTRESVEAVHRGIKKIILEDVTLHHNNLVGCARAGTANISQLLQCVGPRSTKPSDVDGSVFQTPLTRGYFQGIVSPYELIVEASSGSKTYYFSETPLQEAEYFARRLQLVAMVLSRIHRTDCGSTRYFDFQVQGPVTDGNQVVYGGDLPNLIGMWYWDEESRSLKVIKETDKHLEGRWIKMRSILYCQHPDAHGCCEVCFGQLADNISDTQNLGHVVSAILTQQTTQKILSVKHDDPSAAMEILKLDPRAAQYFSTPNNLGIYYFKREVVRGNLQLRIPKMFLSALSDIMMIDVNNIHPAALTRIDFVGVKHVDKEGELGIPPSPIPVSVGNRKAFLSRDFLKYVKAKKWGIDNFDNFVFDMRDWDYRLPVLQLPEMEYNYSEHSSRIARIIEAKVKDISERLKPESPAATATELFRLVNGKLRANMSVLSAIVYANMIKDGKNLEWGLARGSESPSLGVLSHLIERRSMGPLWAYQSQSNAITNPQTFFQEDRPDSILDVFISPREVIHYYLKSMTQL